MRGMQSSWLPVSRRVWSSGEIVNREGVSVRFACATTSIIIVFFLRARARFCAGGSLSHLDLFNNNIGDEGAKAIADAVAASGSLTYLEIGNNNIGDEGAKALAAGISASGPLALKKLVVADGVAKHAGLKTACKSKSVELV